MATSGTTTFNLDITDLIEEAYELAGSEVRGGYSMKTARRSLDMLMREWGNRGVNFWTLREQTLAIPAGTATFSPPADTIDILDMAWRTGDGIGQNDRILMRIDMVQWSQTANKNNQGSPTLFYVQRVVPPVVRLWPVPIETGTLYYWSLRSIEDTGAYGNTMDIPPRFLPAMTTGLAYLLAMKMPDADSTKLVVLKTEYDRQWTLASEEDRERAPFKLVPDLSR